MIKRYGLLVYVCVILNYSLMHGIANVQKNLIQQLLNYSVAQSVPLTADKIHTALTEAAGARESLDEEQHILLYLLLNHAQLQGISLSDIGLGAALINGSQSVAKEIATLLLNHASNNSITLLAADIESALQAAAQEWALLSDDQISVIFYLLNHAKNQGIVLSESGLGLALKEACITLQTNIVRLILNYAEQQSITLSAASLEAAATEIVQDRNATATSQSTLLFLLLDYAKRVGVALTADGLGDIITEASKKYVSPSSS